MSYLNTCLLITFSMAMWICSVSAQKDYTLDIKHSSSYEYQRPTVFPIDDRGGYISISQAKETAEVFPHNQLEIIRYDSCGVADYQKIVMDDLFGIANYKIYGIHRDSLVIYGRAYSNDHPYSDGFIARISLDDYGFAYNAYRFTEGAFLASIEINSDNTIYGVIVHNQADKPLRYHMMRLTDYSVDKIVNMNIGNFTLGGSMIAVDGGGFIAHTDRYIWRANHELDIVWYKEIVPRVFINLIKTDANHFVAYSRKISRPYVAQLVKINMDGEIVSRSQNFLDIADQSLISLFRQADDGSLLCANMNWSRDTVDAQMIVSTFNNDLTIARQFSWDIDPYNNNTYINDVRLKNNRLFWISSKGSNTGFFTGTLDSEDSYCPTSDIIARRTIDPLYELVDVSAPEFSAASTNIAQYSYPAENFNLIAIALCAEPFIIPESMIPEDTTICSERPFMIDLSSIPYDVQWSDGHPSRLRAISESGIFSYTYSVCDSIYTESVTVTAENCSCVPYIANAFTPNDDGDNDVWEFQGNCSLIDAFSVQVYNRWGNLVYQSTDPSFKWNGMNNSQPVSPGVYIYLIEYRDLAFPQAEQKRIKGDLTLLR